MARPFPDQPYLRSSDNYGPIFTESDAPDLPVVGELPKGLHGSLYRTGPNPMYAPRDSSHHWFAGDGMVHAFHFENGRVSYRNRWVRTPKLLREMEAGKSLFGNFGNPMTSDPSVHDADEGVANTNLIPFGGRLLALEEAHKPIELDPVTLSTVGYQDFRGGLDCAMTAHPKLDPVSGQLVGFAYSAKGFKEFSSEMAYHVIEADGRVSRSFRFDAPFTSMVHDFMVTRDFALFPVLPLTGSLERAMKGLPPFAWEPEKGSHIGVLPRSGGPRDIRWFRGDPCYVFHPLNAWNEGRRIVADVMKYEAAPLFPNADGSPGDPTKTVARLVRWIFDLDATTEGYREEPLDDLNGEFPRVDDRRSGLAHRHGWIACKQDPHAGPFDGLAHYDLASGRRTIWRAAAGEGVSEPVFVPRTLDAAEGDGWILAVLYRAEEKRSDLLMFEAQELSAGPVATIQLSHRIPFGFHGNWREARR